ncbi:hypothetical protein [Kitasatospora purpeofusca]|uniref:hypothetical protein n=1 Tax=Kitasatospora purpeofusca TaxID=67352 RepID=UPI0036D3FF37
MDATTRTEPGDSAAGPVGEPVAEEVTGGGRRASGRTWALAAGALVVLAAAVTGGVVLLGDDEPAVVRQTLCGFRRDAGTPLNSLMPKGKPGVEDWRTKVHDDGSPDMRSCWITVDGEEGLAVQLAALGADDKIDAPAGARSPRELAGRGIMRTEGVAAGMVPCPGNPDRVAVVSVMLHPALYLEKPDEAAVAEQTRLLGVLADQVGAERLAEVCG